MHEQNRETLPEPETRASKLAHAFDTEAENYCRFDDHPSVQIMRRTVHRVYAKFLQPGDRVLDLNCGPGSDMAFFHSLGAIPTGLDLSSNMLEHARRAHPRTRFLQMDYNRIGDLDEPFDAICSNFGGLNTQGDFTGFAAQCRRILQPRGLLFINIMTPLPMMEILDGLLTRRHAFRRLRNGGRQRLRVGNREIDTWYFHPGTFFRRNYSGHFELLAMRGLGVFLPPPYRFIKAGFFFQCLSRLEGCFAGVFPFNRLGDHTLLTMRVRK